MLRVENLCKTLPDGRKLLEGISFKVERGEFVGVLGASGAGKSLTLRCVLGLTKASSGVVEFDSPNGDCHRITDLKQSKLRSVRRHIGVIFQGLNLVQQLTVIENVMIGRLGSISPVRSWLYGFKDSEAEEALEALKEVKMGGFADRSAYSLSGGEMQRVAIARAIFQTPALYLADEPISSLDPKNSKSIMKILKRLADRTPVLGVFHQPELVSKYCTRIIAIKDGKVAYDGEPKLSSSDISTIYGEEAHEFDLADNDPEGLPGADFRKLSPVVG